MNVREHPVPPHVSISRFELILNTVCDWLNIQSIVTNCGLLWPILTHFTSPNWTPFDRMWPQLTQCDWLWSQKSQPDSCSCSCLPALASEKLACANSTSRWTSNFSVKQKSWVLGGDSTWILCVVKSIEFTNARNSMLELSDKLPISAIYGKWENTLGPYTAAGGGEGGI